MPWVVSISNDTPSPAAAATHHGRRPDRPIEIPRGIRSTTFITSWRNAELVKNDPRPRRLASSAASRNEASGSMRQPAVSFAHADAESAGIGNSVNATSPQAYSTVAPTSAVGRNGIRS